MTKPAPDPQPADPLIAQLRARRERLLGPAYRLFYEQPVHLVKGEGVWLYDRAGAAYLDVYNNVPCVGHSHPHVIAAVSKQASLLNTHTRYLHETILEYAERLLSRYPAELANVMFTCSGSEACDLATRIAKAATNRTGFIVTENAYHGATSAIADMSPSLGRGVAPHVQTVALPFGSQARADLPALFADNVRRAIDALQRRGIELAALLVDTVFSTDGIHADPPGFLACAAQAVRAAGGLVIADEVQAGFGRTGASLWGFQRHGFIPDIVVMGKPMGNGYPLAGIAIQPQVLEPFARQTRYFNTFGGNPVACAAGLAVLEVIDNERLMENAAVVGGYLRSALTGLAGRHPALGEIRGTGLFIGIDIAAARGSPEPARVAAERIVNELRRRRILIGITGAAGNVLKIRPPLPFTRQHADVFLEALEAALRCV